MPLNPGDVVTGGEITSSFDQHQNRPRPSAGVDIDRRGLPEGSRVEVRSPVAGTVTRVSERWGMVRITDSAGNNHEFIHLSTSEPTVGLGEPVSVGDRIGAMGNTVPAGNPPVRDHVHYQIKDPAGNNLNPETFDYESNAS